MVASYSFLHPQNPAPLPGTRKRVPKCFWKEGVITRDASSCFQIEACSQVRGQWPSWQSLRLEKADGARPPPGLCLPHFTSLPKVFGVFPVIAEMSNDCSRKSGLLWGDVPQLLARDFSSLAELRLSTPSPTRPSWLQLQLCSWLLCG
uniref:Uncharacterized protein n=1 Tax=Prolemur simus TaxID=1328070 RepID=A0A8C9A412_PROSS